MMLGQWLMGHNGLAACVCLFIQTCHKPVTGHCKFPTHLSQSWISDANTHRSQVWLRALSLYHHNVFSPLLSSDSLTLTSSKPIPVMPVPLLNNVIDVTKIYFYNHMYKYSRRMKHIIFEILGKRITSLFNFVNVFNFSDVINMVCAIFSAHNGLHVRASSSHLFQPAKCKESFEV